MGRYLGRLDTIGAGLVLLVTQLVYLQTMTLTCPFWDSGEFIATSYILGIPHPPGTPLYVLIGRFFTLLPFGSIATRVNWLSALASSAAAVFTYLIVVEVLRRMWRGSAAAAGVPAGGAGTGLAGRAGTAPAGRGMPAAAVSEEEAPDWVRWAGFFGGIAAALFTAFGRTFWDNAIEAEVYALSNLIMSLAVWLALRWGRLDGERERRNGLFLLLYYVICLSMGIHLGTFLVLPGIVLFMLLVDHRSFAPGWTKAILAAGLVLLLHPGMLPTLGMKIWGPLVVAVLAWSLLRAFVGSGRGGTFGAQGILTWCAVAAILGISTHLYLMIRAHLDPAINEADPQTWDALWKVLTRDQYKPPNPFEVRKAPLAVQLTKHFWDYTKDQYHLGLRPSWLGSALPYLLGLGGLLWHAWRDHRGFALLGVNYLLMTLGLVFYLNFQTDEVRPRDYFFVASFQFYTVWIGLGVAALVRLLWEGLRQPALVRVGGVALAALPLLTCRFYWHEHDRTDFYVARDFAYNMLIGLKPDAIIFTNGDNDTFPLWYLQEVEKIRRDVRVANLSLLNTDWYIRQLRDQAPKVDIGWSDAEISRLRPYWDTKADKGVYVKDLAVHHIVGRESGKRPLYVATTVPDLMGLESRLVMKGVVFEVQEAIAGREERIDADATLHALNEVYLYRGLLLPDGRPDDSVYKDENARRLVQNYSAALLQAAEAKLEEKDKEAALAAIEKAQAVSPGSRAIRYSTGLLLLRAGEYEEAERRLNEVLAEIPDDPRIFRLLGRAQEAGGRLDEAEATYRRMVAADPGDFEYFGDFFSFLWQVREKRSEAVDLLRGWAERHPDEPALARTLQAYEDSLAFYSGRSR